MNIILLIAYCIGLLYGMIMHGSIGIGLIFGIALAGLISGISYAIDYIRE